MILITSGEPAGIGPDIILKFTQHVDFTPMRWVVLGDIALFRARAEILNIDILIQEYLLCNTENQFKSQIPSGKPILWIWNIPLRVPVKAGVLDRANAVYVLEQLYTGTKACMSGSFDALVTCPIHKGIICDALSFSDISQESLLGYLPLDQRHKTTLFSGHTEYFAELTQTEEVVMLLASVNLRVALVTTHLPLRDVSDAITEKKLLDVIHILHKDFRQYFNVNESDNFPKIYVSGLNPHAGENGHLGREELDIIIPALEKIRKSSTICVEGPFPADTLFTKNYLEKADVFLAMYHDQGLSVLKYAAFDNAVNITLGLPFIRTSVDHGTALALAGTGKASEQSLIYAVQMAEKMIQAKSREKSL